MKSVVTKTPWFKRPAFWLTVILVVAAALRLYNLAGNPPSLYWEENALGYDAYSILKTGKDQHGNPYPLIAFPSFGDYKPSGYFYAIVPFIKLFGLNAWAVRLPSALAGIISVALIYLIGRELFSQRVGLLSAAVLAVQPWAIQFSRGGWETNLALTLLLAGSYCFIRARKRIFMLFPAAVFLIASMYTYHAERLFAPLIGLVGGLIILYISRRSGKRLLVIGASVLLAVGLLAPLLINLKSSTVSSRFTDTSIFSDLKPVLESNAAIAAHGNTKLARIMYHRYLFFLPIVLKGYASHFSPVFLFVRGDGNLRHGTAFFGLMYPIDALLILVTLVAFVLQARLSTKHPKALGLVIVWIMLAAVPASLVLPTPHALRFLIAAPGFALLVGYALALLPKKVLALTIVVYGLFAASFVWYYHVTYPIKAAADWQYGYVPMYQAVARYKQASEPVYITRDEGRPSMYYLFQTAYDPAQLQSQESKLPKDQLELLRVGDYHFVDGLPQTSGLFVTPQSKVDPKATVLDTIKRLDGSVVWVIWRR